MNDQKTAGMSRLDQFAAAVASGYLASMGPDENPAATEFARIVYDNAEALEAEALRREKAKTQESGALLAFFELSESMFFPPNMSISLSYIDAYKSACSELGREPKLEWPRNEKGELLP
jgi:hypothetical protein